MDCHFWILDPPQLPRRTVSKPALTPRQTEIAELIGKGKSTREIADITGLSTHTVEHHVRVAAANLPGNTNPRHKLLMWSLGISPDQITEK